MLNRDERSGALSVFVSNRRSHQVTDSDSTSSPCRFRCGRDLGTARSFCVIDDGPLLADVIYQGCSEGPTDDEISAIPAIELPKR
jgi:hypothetical protein